MADVHWGDRWSDVDWGPFARYGLGVVAAALQAQNFEPKEP